MEKIAKIGNEVVIAKSVYNSKRDGIWTTERWDWDGWETERVNYIGKRMWTPPFFLFEKTCLLVEGQGFSIISDKEFDKLYLHSVYQAKAHGYYNRFNP